MSSKADEDNDGGQLLMTDGEGELLPTLRENCLRNEVTADCLKLWWGAGPDLDALCASFSEGFESIVGADLVYSSKQVAQVVPALFYTVSRLLAKNKDAAFYLAVTRRNFGIAEVLDEATKHGLVWSVDEDTIWDIFDNNTDEQTVFWRDSIYIFRRTNTETETPAAASLHTDESGV